MVIWPHELFVVCAYICTMLSIFSFSIFFIRRTRTFHSPSCRTLFSSRPTTPSSSSMTCSGGFDFQYKLVFGADYHWMTSVSGLSSIMLPLRARLLECVSASETIFPSAHIRPCTPCITVCNVWWSFGVFLLRLNSGCVPPLSSQWCLWKTIIAIDVVRFENHIQRRMLLLIQCVIKLNLPSVWSAHCKVTLCTLSEIWRPAYGCCPVCWGSFYQDHHLVLVTIY